MNREIPWRIGANPKGGGTISENISLTEGYKIMVTASWRDRHRRHEGEYPSESPCRLDGIFLAFLARK
jgi:hypothetical protein